MVGARVLPGDEDDLRLLEVVEADGALADADGFRKPAAARLVAHVRAVGEVVGAVLANEELVEEGGLVAGAAAGIEDRLVGTFQRPQLGAEPGEGLVQRVLHRLDDGRNASCDRGRRPGGEGHGGLWRLRAGAARVEQRVRRGLLQRCRTLSLRPPLVGECWHGPLQSARATFSTPDASASSNQKSAPPSAPVRTPTVPPCETTSRFTVASPSPMPGTSLLC